MDDEGMTIYDADGNRLMDIRGWGALTGTGGLNLSEEVAESAQKQLGEFVIHTINNTK